MAVDGVNLMKAEKIIGDLPVLKVENEVKSWVTELVVWRPNPGYQPDPKKFRAEHFIVLSSNQYFRLYCYQNAPYWEL